MRRRELLLIAKKALEELDLLHIDSSLRLKEQVRLPSSKLTKNASFRYISEERVRQIDDSFKKSTYQ